MSKESPVHGASEMMIVGEAASVGTVMSQLDQACALLENDIQKIKDTGDNSLKKPESPSSYYPPEHTDTTGGKENESATDEIEVEIQDVTATESGAIVQKKSPKKAYAKVLLFFSFVEIIIMFSQMTVAGWAFENVETNFFLGPKDSANLLIRFGAKYGPIMKGSSSEAFRFFTAIFIHVGFVHLICNLSMQLSLCAKVEQAHGPLKSLIIFFVCGICGNIVSAVFVPNSIECGSSGSIFGYMGVIMSDYIKNIKRIKRRKYILFVLVITILTSFAVGLLPVIDNFAHLGGFVSGVIIGFAIVPDIKIRLHDKAITEEPEESQISPPISTGKYRTWTVKNHPRLSYVLGFMGPKQPHWPWWYASWIKRSISVVILIILVVLGLVAFYDWVDAKTGWCDWCLFFSCLPVFELCKLKP